MKESMEALIKESFAINSYPLIACGGFSLLEVMISLSIFTLGILSLHNLQQLAYEQSFAALLQSYTVNQLLNERASPS